MLASSERFDVSRVWPARRSPRHGQSCVDALPDQVTLELDQHPEDVEDELAAVGRRVMMDPIRFAEKLRVTIQALGWRSPLEGQKLYLPLQDDITSTALWYQTEPHAAYPPLPDLNGLEVV